MIALKGTLFVNEATTFYVRFGALISKIAFFITFYLIGQILWKRKKD
jgi:hypothetical protein